ncbi:hypothetical protein [uncultured Bradyrhizobium sp.]|uniref:hypothetical protein n=1 Tax=uncultured Bradyrhizobium sp. TaxID=199684 RepID=UPI0035CC494F
MSDDDSGLWISLHTATCDALARLLEEGVTAAGLGLGGKSAGAVTFSPPEDALSGAIPEKSACSTQNNAPLILKNAGLMQSRQRVMIATLQGCTCAFRKSPRENYPQKWLLLTDKLRFQKFFVKQQNAAVGKISVSPCLLMCLLCSGAAGSGVDHNGKGNSRPLASASCAGLRESNDLLYRQPDNASFHSCLRQEKPAMTDDELLAQAPSLPVLYFDGYGAWRKVNGVIRCVGFTIGLGGQYNIITSIIGAEQASRDTRQALDAKAAPAIAIWSGALAH